MPGTDLVKRPDHLPVLPGGQPKRESEALIPRAFRSVRRNRHLSVPLAIPPVMWTAGEIMHANGLGQEVTAGGVMLAGAVWFFAPHKWTGSDGKPRMKEVWYARGSAAAGAAWLSAATWAGAASGTWGEVLGGLLLAGGFAWGFPWWRHHRPRGLRKRAKMLAYWQAWWDSHSPAWSLAHSRVIDATETGVTIRLRVQLWAGHQSFHDVKAAVHKIESALQGLVEVGRVRIEVNKRNPSQVDLFFKRENPLREIVDWDPALAPASVHGQAVDGMSETGQWVFTTMRANGFVGGRTRSGKGNHLKLRIAQLSGCPDDRQVVIDLKEGRSARPLIEAGSVEYVITDVDEARMYLLMLTQEIRARAKYCYTGEEQLEATPEVPALHTFIDETRLLTAPMGGGDAESTRHLATITSQGNGLEVYTEVYTQYGSLEESVGTEQTRSNLLLRAVYAVEKPSHGQFFIEDFDKFDASKLEEKGTHLLKPGPKAHTEQIRSPLMTDDLLKRITAANARKVARPPLKLACGDWPCPAGGTWQQWWDTRWLRLDPDYRAVSPQYTEAAARSGDAAASEAAGAGVTLGAAPVVTIAPAPSVFGEGDGASVAARLAAETEGPDIPPPDRKTRARLTEVVRAGRDAFCDALAGASSGISPGQLEQESGMSSSWIYPRLGKLADLGVITKPRQGVYVPVPGADIHAALARVDGEAEVLLKDARQTVRRLSAVGDRQ